MLGHANLCGRLAQVYAGLLLLPSTATEDQLRDARAATGMASDEIAAHAALSVQISHVCVDRVAYNALFQLDPHTLRPCMPGRVQVRVQEDERAGVLGEQKLVEVELGQVVLWLAVITWRGLTLHSLDLFSKHAAIF